MRYGKRIDTLCSLLEKTEIFADIGCDHGYCSEYMLENGLCERAILSDISKGSLQKAEKLLAGYIADGKAVPVLGNGFFGVDESVGEVLIAGMGGSEIVKILSDERYGFLPKRFVFQPMHDGEKLRRYLVENGGYITRDFTFEAEGKYYDVLCGRRALADERQRYTDAEYEFGKDNLKERGEEFLARIRKLLKATEGFLKAENLQEESRKALLERQERLLGVLNGEIK